MADLTIPLGPFELIEPLGKGAMGVVWKAIHRQQQVPVAVKIIAAHNAQASTFREAFQNEVRAVTRLHHPSIVMVLDYGEIPKETAEASNNVLPAGSLYFAMEYANAGTLPRPKLALPWNNTKFILLELLDALAHAHARNVIHRDIKPSNVLLSRTPETGLRLKITDFGVAKAFGTRDFPVGTVAGTPRYMPPEQIMNEIRDQGPWTDLYSLGCLAYQFACGRRIFADASGTELLRCQLQCEPEPIQGEHLPRGFQNWLNKMLAKKVRDRFHFAAEAAWELACLPPPEESQPPLSDFPSLSFNIKLTDLENEERASEAVREVNSTSGVQETADTSAFNELVSSKSAVNPLFQSEDLSSELLDGVGDTIRMNLADVERALSRQVNAYNVQNTLRTLSELFETPQKQNLETNDISELNHPKMPVPTTWRRTTCEAPSQQLLGAGLGLCGLRSIPLVDRLEERDCIYNLLLETRKTKTPHCLLIDGPRGTGKTRLVEWMTQRIHELSIASTIKAIHYPELYNTPGLARSILYYLHCDGLTKFEALTRVQNFIKEHPLKEEFDDAHRLVELMHLNDDPHHQVPKVRFNDIKEKFDVVYRFLQRLTLERPTILWLDDVQWSSFSLAFVDYLFERAEEREKLPLLVITTLNDEDLDRDLPIAALYQHIQEHPQAHSIHLEPLKEEQQRILVKQLLDLDEDLCKQVVDRTNGTPLFAIQLVGSWVERGILTPGPKGFILKEGASTSVIPDNLHELWITRLRGIFKNHDRAQYAWEALEVAACLGDHFDPGEWRRACALEDLGDVSEVMELMLTHKLFEVKFAKISFTHNTLQDSLIRYAQENARYKRHNNICADMLEQANYKDTLVFYHERRANYLVKAENYEACIEHLLQAANIRTQRAEYTLAHKLFALRETALVKCKANTASPIYALGWVAHSRTYLLESHLEEAFALIQKSLKLATEIQSTLILALASKELGQLYLAQNSIANALEAFTASIDAFNTLSERRQRVYLDDKADAYTGFSKIYFYQHEISLSKQYLAQAINMRMQTKNNFGLAACYRILGNCLHIEGNIDGALANFTSAQRVFEAEGHRLEVAKCFNNIGELYRTFYNIPEYAEQYYRNAIYIIRETRSYDSSPYLNLAFVLLSKQQFTEARNIFLERIDLSTKAGHFFDLNWAFAGMLPCCAAAFDWPLFEYYSEQLSLSLQSSNVVDIDILYCTELAVNLCLRFGTLTKAKLCLSIAKQQAQALNDTDAITRLKAVPDDEIPFEL